MAAAWLAGAQAALDAIEASPAAFADDEWAALAKRVAAVDAACAKAKERDSRSSSLVDDESRAKSLEQRRMVLGEMVSTEQSYVACLQTLVNDYAHALADSGYADGGAVAPAEHVYRIFSNVEDILLVNQELLAQLKARIEDEASHRVGDIFLNMSFALRIYSRYIGDYDAARNTLCECEALPRFTKFVQEVEEKTAEAVRGQKLASLMIQPVQRIPRYELLLRELVKANRKLGDEEYADELASCMDAVKEVAEQNNERIRSTESKALLYDLQRRFASKDVVLVGPRERARLFVKEGRMTKVHGRGGATAEIILILLSDQLLYATEAPTSSKPDKLLLHRRIDLVDGATSFEDHGIGDHAVAILNADKSMICLCASAADKATWLSTLSATQATARQRAGGSASPGGAVAMSLWQQDTTHCTISRVKFTPMLRRHHCRVNGECVAQDASKARVDLQGVFGSDRFGHSERVCDWCCRDFTLTKAWPAVIQNRLSLRKSIEGLRPGDSAAALAILRRCSPDKGVVYGSWLWKKGGAGAADGKGRAGLFGRRNWKKRWCEIRCGEKTSELLYFEEPGEGDENCKGRVDLAGATVRVDSATLLTFTLTDFRSKRDYPIKLLDHESLKDVSDQDRGAFQLWIAALEDAAQSGTAVTPRSGPARVPFAGSGPARLPVAGLLQLKEGSSRLLRPGKSPPGSAGKSPSGAGPPPANRKGASPPPPPPPPKVDTPPPPPMPLTARDPRLASADWYWQHANGGQHGPCDFGTLAAAHRAGGLTLGCHVFAEEVTGAWKVVDTLPFLKKALLDAA